MNVYARIDNTSTVLRSDNAHIPADPLNTDWQVYQNWLKAGNEPAAPTTMTSTTATPAEPQGSP